MDPGLLSENQSLKVLVVDDDEDNLLLITHQLLLITSCSIVCAKDGSSALSEAQASQPDLILLDIMLPHMDGFEVARRLKQDPQTRSIPIIAVTAMARPEDQQVALQSGCDGYLSKPYELEHLIEIISHYLDLSSLKPDDQPTLESESENKEEGGQCRNSVTSFDSTVRLEFPGSSQMSSFAI